MLKTHLKSIVVRKADSTILLQYFLIVFLFYILKDPPLFEAAGNGQTDVVRLLIENGADVNKEVGVR